MGGERLACLLHLGDRQFMELFLRADEGKQVLFFLSCCINLLLCFFFLVYKFLQQGPLQGQGLLDPLQFADGVPVGLNQVLIIPDQ